MPQKRADDFSAINQALSYYIRPSTFPVAIKMVSDASDLPPKVKRPKKDMNIAMFLCQAINISRRTGWSFYLEKKDISCPNALIYLGFAKAPDGYMKGEFVFAPYNQTVKARIQRSKYLAKFPVGEFRGILISPLHKADFDPDVVLVYGNAAQMMRFVQASVFKGGSPMHFTAQGGGSCASEVVAPIKKNKVNLVLPGNGERIFGQVHDDEMVFAIPFKKIKYITKSLEDSHNGGQRYPIPKYGSFEPVLPSGYQHLLKLMEKGN